MTNYIVEGVVKGIYCEFVDDGIDQVVFITPESSVFKRDYREPPELKKAMGVLTKLTPKQRI
jgi:hypothetical protein